MQNPGATFDHCLSLTGNKSVSRFCGFISCSLNPFQPLGGPSMQALLCSDLDDCHRLLNGSRDGAVVTSNPPATVFSLANATAPAETLPVALCGLWTCTLSTGISRICSQAPSSHFFTLHFSHTYCCAWEALPPTPTQPLRWGADIASPRNRPSSLSMLPKTRFLSPCFLHSVSTYLGFCPLF